MSISPAPLLEVVDLTRHFPVRNAFGRRTGWIRAVDGVSIAVQPGETLGWSARAAAASRPSARR